MATAPITSEAELDRLLRGLREGGAEVLLSIDDLFGLDKTAAARAASGFPGNTVRDAAKVASNIPGVGARGAVHAKRFAMNALNNPLLKTGLRYAPVAGAALSAGDLLLGDESIGNKAMDAAAMGIGGIVGSAVPVVGTGLGITGGKLISDLTQYLLGGGLTGGN